MWTFGGWVCVWVGGVLQVVRAFQFRWVDVNIMLSK